MVILIKTTLDAADHSHPGEVGVRVGSAELCCAADDYGC